MKTKLAATAAALAAAGLSILPTGVAQAADGGYGPTAPTGPTGTPGGFSSVVTTSTVDATGGVVSGSVAGAAATVTVPTGAFSTPVQVEVTAPTLTDITPSTLSNVGFSSYKAVAGLGVKVLDTSGQPITGTFAKTLDVTLTGSSLGVSGEKVLMLNGTSAASVVSSTLGSGSITIHLSEDPNLVVVNSTAAAVTPTVPGATLADTGKPFVAEKVGALALLGLGAGVVVYSRRRRTADTA